ncbi:Arc family DNA-binding protein [Chromobacterium haemolyticum]|uniref:Arc family DNA-binding protein n=1 Tax=Chromobacterium haemolyticum TaxID=394935 RepID=UPI0009D99F8B|nr:Arc family DNA-binding protein [Chromobacterium haemolyticum]
MEKEPQSTVGRESDKFMLRLPDGMREHIAELAKANGRSMNAEIVIRLVETFSSAPRVTEGMVNELNLYKTVFEIFKATSPDFDSEIADRMRSYIQLIPETQVEPWDGEVSTSRTQELKELLRKKLL